MTSGAVGAESVLSGRYRLVEPLASGGMGTVWRGTDLLLDREVAIKEVRLPPGLDAESRETMRRRTIREAQAAARLRHPAIVTVYDVVDQDDRPWIVMEYVPAPSLADVIRTRGPLPPARVAAIGMRILDAMVTAQAAGVQHRDIKPANVLIDDSGRVVLTDFGIARHVGDETLTSAGLLVGSPDYLSPERARGLPSPGLAADLWSLGATLYDAVEGRRPFERDGPLPTLAAVVMDEPPPPKLAGPLRPVIDGLLVKDPAHRLDAERTRAMLQRVIRGRPAGSTMPIPPADRPTIETRPAPERASGGDADRPEPTLSAPTLSEPHPQDGPARTSPAEPAEPAQPVRKASVLRRAAAGAAAAVAAARAEPATPVEIRTPTEPPGGPIRPTDRPATGAPTAGGLPVGGTAAGDRPAAGDPITGEPTRDRPAAGDPTTGEPTRDRPAAGGLTAGRPAAGEPATTRPAAGEPATDRPRVDRPAAGEPATTRLPAGAADTRDLATRLTPAPAPDRSAPDRSAPDRTRTEPGPTRRRSRRLPVLAGLVVLALAAVAGLLVPGLLDNDAPGGQAGPAATGAPPATAPASAGAPAGAPAPSATAAGSPTAGGPAATTRPTPTPRATTPRETTPTTPTRTDGTDGTGAAVAAPAGFTRYTDRRDGFSVVVPDGWRAVRDRSLVDFEDPATSRFLRIDTSDDPRADPYTNWVSYERDFRQGRANYTNLGIRRVAYRPAEGWSTADWEFTLGGTHVLNRNVRVSDDRAHAIYWSTPQRLWDTAESRRIFRLATASFDPGPADR